MKQVNRKGADSCHNNSTQLKRLLQRVKKSGFIHEFISTRRGLFAAGLFHSSKEVHREYQWVEQHCVVVVQLIVTPAIKGYHIMEYALNT